MKLYLGEVSSEGVKLFEVGQYYSQHYSLTPDGFHNEF